MSKKNPWQARFAGLTSRDAVKSRATVKATPLLGTLQMTDHDAQQVVEAGLKTIHVVSDQELDLLVKYVGIAAAHCAASHADMAMFARHLDAEDIELNVPPPICLTGLPGVGKTDLLKALGRVMPDDTTVELGSPYRTSFELVAYRRVEVRAKATISQILYPFLPLDAQPRKKLDRDGAEVFSEPKIPLPEMIRLATRFGYISGTCLNVLDELQFFTGSSAANTKVAQAMMTAKYIQVPLLCSVNYSLCHRLLKRPQEERDRLLADIDILMPEMPGSLSHTSLLEEYQVALGEILDFKLKDEADEFHKMSIGIRRNVGRVMVSAHKEMRRLKHKKLTMDHVRAGYKAKGLAVMRADIAHILEQAYSSKPLKGKSDLWCPFGLEFNQIKAVVEKAKETKASAVVTSLMKSALTATERRALKFAESGKLPDQRAAKAKVYKLGARQGQPLDASTLLANTVSHKDSGGKGQSK